MSLELPVADPGDPRYTTRGAVYVPAGQGPTIWAASDVYTVKATAAQTGGLLGFLEASVPPGGGPEPHAHNDQAETFSWRSAVFVSAEWGHSNRSRGPHAIGRSDDRWSSGTAFVSGLVVHGALARPLQRTLSASDLPCR